EVILGCVGQVGEDAFNARLATLKAGLPEKTTAFNVNRLCGSGLQAINSAVQELRTGEAQVVVAGGNENMSIQPYLLPRSQVGWRLGEATLIDGTMSLVTDPFGRYQMGSTAEKVTDRYGVSREAQDKFAAESQRRAADAVAGIAPEIMGVAPIFAVQNLLKKVGMTINDIDLMELNEAFAAQAVAVIRELEIDPQKVNPNGGAIALGHPVGATGAILTVK